MNSKMTTNSKPPATEPKKKNNKKQTKQTTRRGTESQKWRSQGSLSAGRGRGRMVEKVQGIRSIIGRHNIDGGRPKWYRKQRTQRTYMYNPWT